MKGIIIHCSDTPDERDVKAADIHRWHKERGWAGIGYHYVIGRAGKVEVGRPEYWLGSHTVGFNDRIGICIVGRSKFTEEQFKSLATLIKDIMKRNKFTKEQITGHCDHTKGKTCPNFDVKQFIKERL